MISFDLVHEFIVNWEIWQVLATGQGVKNWKWNLLVHKTEMIKKTNTIEEILMGSIFTRLRTEKKTVLPLWS